MRSFLVPVVCCTALACSAPPAAPDAGADAGLDAGTPYDATYSAGPFTVDAGTEIVVCTFVTGQNSQDEDVQSFETVQSVGGHHLIVYTVDHPINLPPTPCLQGGQPGWDQVIGTQDELQQITLPPGVGFHIKANQQFIMETHYINATTAPMTVHSSFSVSYSTPGSVTQQAHPYFFGSLNIAIPPNASWSTQSTCSPPDPVNLFALAGHEHRMGTGVTVGLIVDGGPEQQIYTTEQWDSPPTIFWDAGLPLTPNDQIHVTCNWTNQGSDRLSYPQEMCYAVGMFWPGPGALFCALGGGDATDCVCGYSGTVNPGAGGSTVAVNVSLESGIAGVLGDSPASGDPIYCSLYRAQDWPVSDQGPIGNAQPYYQEDVEGVALGGSATGTVTFTDVTPGEYSAFCFMDTVAGGFILGTGDPINYPVGDVTAVAGTTAQVGVVLDLGLPASP